MLRNKKKGFTLIELVIVIAIIGVLVAIAVPRFSQASQNAKNRAIESNARTIASSMTQYYAKKLSWPDSTQAAQKTEVLDAAGIKTADQAAWTFKHVPATAGGSGGTATQETIEIKYTLPSGDSYNGGLGSESGGVVTFKL